MGREHGAQRLAGTEIPGTHVLLEEAAISAVLNTLGRSHGDVPKPLHDLAPNKHAADGKRALGFTQRGRAASSPRPCPSPASWGAQGTSLLALALAWAPACPAQPLGLALSSCLPCTTPGRAFPQAKPSSCPAQRPLHLQELFTDKLHKFGGQPFYHSWQLCALPATR